MESTVPSRTKTFRVENIPPGTTAEGLKKLFYSEDQPRIEVRSIAPAVNSYELNIQEYTATVTFQALDQTVESPRVLDETISVDSDFHGFTPLNHPQEPIAADVIAVTGLAAHAFGSWAYSPRIMWLRDYLPRDVSNARVLIYGYPSQLHENISRSILSDNSTNFIYRLLAMRESANCQARPLILIGHSLGCLIIKKALSDINGTVGRYSSRLPVRSIIFLGAPHKGLHTTALESLVQSQSTEDMIRELKAESPTLTELNDSFRFVAKNIDILTCYELKKTKTAIKMSDGSWKREGPEEMMVSLDSARQWYPREQLRACNTDHSQIAKLKRGESSIYPEVRRAIKQAILSVGDLYSEAERHYDNTTMSEAYEPDNATKLSRKNLDRHESVPLESLSNRPALDKLKSQSDGAIDQGDDRNAGSIIDRPHRLLTPNAIPLHVDRTSSRGQIGLEGHENADKISHLSPSIYTESAKASIVSKVHSSASKHSESTTSIGTELGKLSIASPAGHSIPAAIKAVSTGIAKEAAATPTDGKETPPIIEPEHITLASLGLSAGADKADQRDPGLGASPAATQSSPEILAREQDHVRILQMQLAGDIICKVNPGVHHEDTVSEGICPGTKSTVYDGQLKIAITEGDLEKALELLAELYDVNCKDEDDRTPLHDAAERRHEYLVQFLLEHGALPRAKTKSGETSLHCVQMVTKAARPPLTESLIDLLLQHRPPLEETWSGMTPLMLAAVRREHLFAGKLILRGASTQSASQSGITVLHCAAKYSGSPDMITLLIKEGALVDAKDSGGETPLHHAVSASKDSVDVVKCLLQAGADKEAQTKTELRPLTKAAIHNNVRCVELLLKSGVNIEAENRFGMNALHHAVTRSSLPVVKMLLDHGADPFARSRTGLLPGGQKPRHLEILAGVTDKKKLEIRNMLREAESAWKQSGKKHSNWRWTIGGL